jgi:hypothetical protein
MGLCGSTNASTGRAYDYEVSPRRRNRKQHSAGTAATEESEVLVQVSPRRRNRKQHSAGTAATEESEHWGEISFTHVTSSADKHRSDMKPDSSFHSQAVRVHSQWSNIQGRYTRLNYDHEAYPAYHNQETATYLFHSSSANEWLIGSQLGGRKYFNSCRSSEKDVRKLVPNMWKLSDCIQGIVEMKAWDTSACPHTVVLRSKFSNLGGRYTRLGDDHEEYPAYYSKENNMYLFHSMSADDWRLSSQLNAASEFNSCKSSEVDVRKLHPIQWRDPSSIDGFHEFVEVDKSAAVDKILITSQFSNLVGGYVRIENLATYPAYHCHENGTYLAHSFQGFWYISKSKDGNDYYAKCNSDLADVRKLVKVMWDQNVVDSIEEITWTEPPEEKSFDSSKFHDTQFPPEWSSLASFNSCIEWRSLASLASLTTGAKDLQLVTSLLHDGVQWIRASDLHRNEQCFLFGQNIESSDVIQGGLGNCWLISAMACVAAYPKVIQSLFDTQQVASNGKYTISLFDAKSCRWTKICIDDCIPCQKRAWWERKGKPVFAQSKPGLIWPMLLEKAFAKLWGGYGALQGGSPGDAWIAMTGCTNQLQYMKEASGRSSDWSLYERSKNDPKCVTPVKENVGTLWDMLMSASQKSFLLAAAMHNDSNQGKNHDKLRSNHSYSILEVAEKGRSRFLKIRNPWGGNECGSLKEDGVFLMSLDDFQNVFDTVYITPLCMSNGKLGGA